MQYLLKAETELFVIFAEEWGAFDWSDECFEAVLWIRMAQDIQFFIYDTLLYNFLGVTRKNNREVLKIQ